MCRNRSMMLRLIIFCISGPILGVVGCLALLACRHAALAEPMVSDFLGPEPGKTYVYQGDEGSRVEVFGVERLSTTSIRVRETATLDVDERNRLGTSTTTSYVISATEGRLIQEARGQVDILLKEPLRDDGDAWHTDFEVIDRTRGESRPLRATCRVLTVEESVVMTAKVPTVTVECVSETEPLSVVEGEPTTDQRIVVTRRFAKNIGLVNERVALRIDSEIIAITAKVLEKIADGNLSGQP